MQRSIPMNIPLLYPVDPMGSEKFDNRSLLLKSRFVRNGIASSVRGTVGVGIVSCMEISSFMNTFVDNL